jgi:RHS repeat-associated protein
VDPAINGRRVASTRTSDGLKRYQLYSFTGALMHSEDQRSNEVVDYINLEGQLVAERSKPINSSTITTRYQHADLRGSPTLVTNAAGTQVERSIEQPFGAPYDGIYRDGPGFTGHATDAASGLSYMQQRYYDPIAMRFLSVDPAQSEFSRYSYGANNPYKFVDPDGRAAVVAVGPMIEGCAANPLCRGAAQQTGRAVAQQVGKAVDATIGETLKEMLHEAMQAQAQAQAAQMEGAENGEQAEDKPDEKPESDSGNSGKREKTEHAIERATEAKTDSSRQVGDVNRVIRDGRNFTDSKTGNNVHVKGDRVVITDRSGKIVSQFKNPRANTQGRIQSGRWVPE